MKRLILFCVVLFCMSSFVFSQTSDNRWGLGFGISTMQYKGELGNQFNDFSPWRNGARISLSRYLSPSFNGVMNLGWNSICATRGNYETDGEMKGHMWSGTLGLQYKFNNGYIFSEDAVIQPYLVGGAGVVSVGTVGFTYPGGSYYDQKSHPNFAYHYGFGTKVRFSPITSMYLEVTDNHTSADNFDASVITPKKDLFRVFSAGLVFALGKPRDSDHDGVSDRKDKCPDTPVGVVVDKNGCPIDSDNDGVPDYLDKCPNTPAGVAVDKNGCPIDSDNDGVPDYLDKCPNTPAGAVVDQNGCPVDSDNDGVPDYLDKCPNTPAGVTVDKNGCPLDSDNDGVPDYLDKCPDTPAGVAVDKDGCPVVAAVVAPEVVSEPVYFATNRYNITRAERVKADRAVRYLKTHPDAQIVISGHADKTGPNEFNLKLSKQRAQIVYKYLLSKKVEKSRIAGVTSYGSSRPAVDGDSPEDLSKNRRTEFELQK